MDDPRPGFLSAVNISACSVQLSNAPIVLLCGGNVPDNNTAPTASLRHALINSQPNFEIFRPEEIIEWHHDGLYSNLLDYEEDLASICSLIVVIPESAGSIAELGAFSQLTDIKERLLVIASSSVNQDSFIQLGILRHIESSNASRVIRFPWNPLVVKPAIDQGIIDSCVSDIQNEIDALRKAITLDTNSQTHCSAAICMLLEHFSALKVGELLEYLKKLGFPLNDMHRLRGLLYLMTQFRLIKRVIYSDSVFYMRDREQFHRVILARKNRKRVDTFRIKVQCLQYYKSNDNESHRKQVIKGISPEDRE